MGIPGAVFCWIARMRPSLPAMVGWGWRRGREPQGSACISLDWDHLLRPLWGQAARLERQAYAALEALEERAAQFQQAQTAKRLEHHLSVWEQLRADAEAKLSKFDQFYALAQQVDAQFALIDLETGQIRDPLAGANLLRSHWKTIEPMARPHLCQIERQPDQLGG